ncbi:MAG: metallophosphoesterase [Clostridia bacterium]|jgi:hypothetical protein|nr:metallophosphoesterase [Clostridia bacterium]
MIHRKVQLPKDKQTRIILVSDLHIGLTGYREDVFDDILADIAKPNTLWIGIGDFVEGREPSHKFYNPDEVTMTVGAQYEYFFDKIRPYLKKCIGLQPGNHEDSLIMKSTINPLLQFCNDNEVPYLGATGYTTLTNGDKEVVMVTNHGAGGGGKVGGSINKGVDYAKTFSGDIVALGHYHKLAVTIDEEKYTSEVDGIKIQRWKPKTIILNGSALEAYQDGSYGGYVEKKMLTPNSLGYAIITIEKDMEYWVRLKAY